VVAALAFHDCQPPVGELHVGEPQAQHLATAQPRQQHRQHHGPVPVRPQRRDQPVRLRRRQDPRQGPRHPHQRNRPRRPLPALPPRRQAPRHRVGLHRRVPAGQQIGVKPGHRRQPPCDRPRRQPRLTVSQPHHAAVSPLVGQELEHVRRRDLHRVPGDHAEERLQVERHRPQRVRPRAPRHELQVTIHEPVTQGITDLAQPRRRPHHLRKAHHGCFPSSASRYAKRSPVY
jgi:hypothetical protein